MLAGLFFLRAVREDLFYAPPTPMDSDVCWQYLGSLACSSITPISVFPSTWRSPSVCVSVCVQISPFRKDTSHMGSGAILLHFDLIFLFVSKKYLFIKTDNKLDFVRGSSFLTTALSCVMYLSIKCYRCTISAKRLEL